MDVNNYTIPELTAILGLSEANLTIYNVDYYTNQYIQKYVDEDNNEMVSFFQQVKSVLTNYLASNNDEDEVDETYDLPVKKDFLNPTLKNTTTRFINLDSSYIRDVPTNYTCTLSDIIKNVLSIRLFSYQIPFGWYVIDASYGNNQLWLYDDTLSTSVAITIPSGNYTHIGFSNTLNQAFITAGVTNATSTFNLNNGKITLLVAGSQWTTTGGDTATTSSIIFYQSGYLNTTLGWLMGFRVPMISVSGEVNGVISMSETVSEAGGVEGSCIVDLNGPKYFMLVVDDYNQNHVNNSLVSINPPMYTPLRQPSYYSTDIPVVCGDNGVPVYEPSAPRTLTNAQLYTLNAGQQPVKPSLFTMAPTNGDILAIIPVKTSIGLLTGQMLVEFSGSLQDNCRTYFGPVNLDRLSVKLLDDKGNVVNLNGVDWCFTLLCECLYQY